ncbi:ribosomal protection-like ABC-F family protein [Anaerococcus lactolyticus]|uniref:ABC transporter, ATP-binding protein n=2 Tax=Anaerococcus lactolyticus TaxID=33032 RepID=C2BH11_9FIRM|nr:ABC-F family ATP-binding cassette domain-containing protein [Anaerococcus lactolyticus]EEI85874.1 ABC transporter, ATP-binding protein [Anaerococcus lactolyticus ATCC 51172]KGF04800.1 thiamine ABC transporter substrate-binding protein [Anaerococcus lactolyticus S7-1-13]
MNVLNVSNLAKSYPNKVIFDGLSFNLEKGDKAGLVGLNGAGKSTLFNILTGRLRADDGKVFIPQDIKVGYLEQILSLDSNMTIYDYCLSVFEGLIKLESEIRDLEKKMSTETDPDKLAAIMDEYTRKSESYHSENGYAIESELEGTLSAMGFDKADFNKKISDLSGGQKARVELAGLLLEKPDLLLLDEPTNHLDIKAINFLENFIKNYKGTAIIISHDRYFLDATVNRMMVLEHGKLSTYSGNYTVFMDKRKKDREVRIHQYKSQQKEIERQEEIIDRLKNLGGSKRKRGISQSRSRQKLLDKMERIEKPIELADTMNLKFTPRIQSGMDVLKVEDLRMSFEGREIFKNISFDIYRNERAAIIGDNGVGKTTLFKIVLGELFQDGGKAKMGESVNVGYFDQEQKSLNLENTIFDEIRDAFPMLTNFEIRSYLAKFMFYDTDVFREISELSGGERARISLLKLMISDCNFILMDEPTNHLDIDSKEILEDAVLDFEGTLLIISHDRYFLNKVASKILDMKSDRMDLYLGNYNYYQEKLREMNMTEEEKATVTKTQIKKERKKEKLKRDEIRAIKNKIKSIEKDMEEIDKKIKDLTKESLAEGFYDDQARVAEVFREMKDLEDMRDDLDEEWLNLNMELEE